MPWKLKFGLWCPHLKNEDWGLNHPLPIPFNPGSRPVFVGSRLFASFQLQNIAQCCIIFPFFSHFPPLFSYLPYTSRPIFSQSPCPLSPSTSWQISLKSQSLNDHQIGPLIPFSCSLSFLFSLYSHST